MKPPPPATTYISSNHSKTTTWSHLPSPPTYQIYLPPSISIFNEHLGSVSFIMNIVALLDFQYLDHQGSELESKGYQVVGCFSGLMNFVAALPSSVFEFERPGCRFSALQRLATYFYKGLLYGLVGFGCGLIGQGIANMIMNAKGRMHTSKSDVEEPPLVKSVVVWGVFLAVSSNTRYQIINGMESLVEASPLAK